MFAQVDLGRGRQLILGVDPTEHTSTEHCGRDGMSENRSGGRALTLDDVFALEAIEDVQISPDGSLVAFVVCREYTEGEHKQLASSIWLAPTDGSTSARQFTAGPNADKRPRWRPDGQALAFLSDRTKD